MNAIIDHLWTIVIWTIILIVFFGINPWSHMVDWVQKLRGKPPIFHGPKKLRVAEDSGKGGKRISTGTVFIATAVVDGNVVQEHVVAKDDQAARNLAAERLRCDPDDVDVEPIIEKVVRRSTR